MEIEEVTPQVAASKVFDGKKEVRIVPMADIQYGAQGCDVDLLKEKVAWAMKEDAYFLGLGDYVDVASPGQRRQMATINLYDSTREFMDDQADKHIKGLMGILGKTKGRWIGMLRGHHYWPFADGTTSDTRLANALGTKFLGDCAAILLRFKIRCAHGTSVTAKLWCHHGVGSGLTAGAVLNRLEHVIKVFSADAYLMAHQHRLAATKVPWIDYEVTHTHRLRWNTKERVLAAVGSFLKGYELGSKDPAGNPAGSYVEKAMLTPTSLGCTMLLIRPRILQGYPRVDVDIMF
jgi:hypothetical protein